MYCGLAFSSLLLPWLCEKYKILNRSIQFCSIALVFSFSFVVFGPVVSEWKLGFLLILTGVFCGAEMVCFTGATYGANAKNSGLIIGVVNTFNMLGGALLQQLIGFLLDLKWRGAVDSNGIRAYSVQDFESAFSVLLLVIILCALASMMLAKQKAEK